MFQYMFVFYGILASYFQEIRFGDNDSLSAITAGMLNANWLFLLTDVDCLYTDNPRTNPDAKPLRRIEDIEQQMKDGRLFIPSDQVDIDSHRLHSRFGFGHGRHGDKDHCCQRKYPLFFSLLLNTIIMNKCTIT
jgi:hypothetical protein